ncbi:unnamed protein product [Closterium sp. NIES-54]
MLGPRFVRAPGAWVFGAEGFQDGGGWLADWSGLECHDCSPQTATSRQSFSSGDCPQPFELLFETRSLAHPHAYLYRVHNLRLDPRASAHRLRPAGDFRGDLLLRSDAPVRPPGLAGSAFGVMATEAERSAVDQGHTAESVHAPLPAPAAAAAAAPPVHPAAVAVSSIPVPLAPASPPSLPLLRGVPASGAAAPVALQALAALPPVQAAVRGPAQGKAVGAGPDSAHLLAPAAAPVQPVVLISPMYTQGKATPTHKNEIGPSNLN